MTELLPAWIDDELSTLNLGDERLDQRQKRVLHRLADQPSLSIPAACGGRVETQAAYRFFAHPAVTEQTVLAPHVDATTRRLAEHPVVLVPQDTTELDFTRPVERVRGAGPLNWEERIGFFQHVELAITPERLPLGVVGVTTWGRDPREHRKNGRRKRKPIEDKESDRWLQGDRRACALAERVPETRIVSISDREGDIFECFVEGQPDPARRKADWIIRACQDRSLTHRPDEATVWDKLWETVEATPALGTLQVQLPRTGQTKARVATLTVRSAAVELKPPYRVGRKLTPVTVHAVLVREEDAPAGVEPIEWLLLTSLEAATFAEACTVVRYYTCRWQVEVFFRVYKSGCRVERLQLEGADRLRPCLALYLIVSWRVLWLTMLGRECPELACDVMFTESEWKSVWMVVHQRPAPATPPSVREMIALVARLGGYLGRSKDGPPGAQSLWVGLRRMADLAVAWETFGPDPPKQVPISHA
jgi:hypothetical protein